MTKQRAKKAKKNSGDPTGTAKPTESSSKTKSSGSTTKEKEAADKVAQAMKKINDDLKGAQGSEWAGE